MDDSETLDHDAMYPSSAKMNGEKEKLSSSRSHPDGMIDKERLPEKGTVILWIAENVETWHYRVSGRRKKKGRSRDAIYRVSTPMVAVLRVKAPQALPARPAQSGRVDPGGQKNRCRTDDQPIH